LEVHPENYMTGAPQAGELDRISQLYPLSLHAVGLSLGSLERPEAHAGRLAALVDRYRPGLVSDHLSWSAVDGMFFPDLFPIPFTEEALGVVTRNVDYVQEVLARQILVENPSTYLVLPQSTLSEAEFLAELVRRCDCGVLLDINNICVGAHNLGHDPVVTLNEFIDRLPPGSVREMHLAGHDTSLLEDGSELRIDDHGSPVCEEVWQLFATAARRLGPCPTLIEWDTRLPEFLVLAEQARLAQEILDRERAWRSDAAA
jgi:hypothetical protein